MEYIDIIMPSYNCEKYVKDAIESVKKQTNKNWRLIIIDDASTDDTVKVIQQNINEIHEKVMLIKSDKHIGVAKVRNLGLKESKNRYIAFLDADDMWKENKLEKQLEFMQKKNYGFTYTLYTYLKSNKSKKVRYFTKELDYKKALGNTFILTSTVMIDTNKINKEYIEMPNIESEDTATWWNILRKGNIAYGMKEWLTMYRVTSTGLSSNKFINLRRTWNLYRKQEKLLFIKSLYYFMKYIFYASIKRII